VLRFRPRRNDSAGSIRRPCPGLRRRRT
jgi:hypothetical protein